MNLANVKQLSKDEMKKIMGGSEPIGDDPGGGQCGDSCSGSCQLSCGGTGECRSSSDGKKCYCAGGC